MSEAMNQAIERLALRLVMRRDMGSATPQTEDDARRLVQCWTDGHRRGGNIAHDALSEYINEAKALIRGLGLIVVPPELVADWRDARAALDRAHDANDEPEIDRGLDVLDEANAAIACAVMEQIGAAK